jgi:hypothetical protein
MVVTAGNINDTTMFSAVLDAIVVPRNGRPGRPRRRPDRVLAGKGYSSRANRNVLRGRGWRGVTTRSDKHADGYEGPLLLAPVRLVGAAHDP